MYNSLNEAAKYFACLAPGATKVFYRKADPLFLVPSFPNLEKDYVLVGEVAGTEPDEIFFAMQGENWSPRGEARELVTKLGMRYTSMSVGDAVQIGDGVLVCSHVGWERFELVAVR